MKKGLGAVPPKGGAAPFGLLGLREGQNALKTGWKSGIILGERMRYTDVSRIS